jgi:hypothetical protein
MCVIGTYFYGSSFVRSLHGKTGWMSLIVKPIVEMCTFLLPTNTSSGHLVNTNLISLFQSLILSVSPEKKCETLE